MAEQETKSGNSRHPVSENEDRMSKLNDVANVLDLPELSQDDVHSLHRLTSRTERVRGVIIRFTRQAIRDKWLENRKVVRAKQSSVSMTENMTRQNRNLLRSTREWVADNGYRFVWHSNNKILLKCQDRAHTIFFPNGQCLS